MGALTGQFDNCDIVTVLRVLFWTPLLLNALLHGRFNGSSLPANPNETAKDRVQAQQELVMGCV